MISFFSIIVPCCDVEPYVRECLDSVLNQPFADWECLIGVETSKDKTEEIVREYAAKDSRFKVFTGPRSGSCSASRNTGIDMATGEYVIFLDGDDTIVEGSLQRLHDKIATRPGADLYPCAIQVHNDMTGKDEELRDNYPSDFTGELTGVEATILTLRRQQNPCPMLQLTVFRRLFLVEFGLRCIYGLRRQDSEFSPRALYLAKRVTPIHEPFYLYRIRTNSVSLAAKTAGYFLKDFAIIIRSLFAFHSTISSHMGFDRRISSYWARQWLTWLFYFWFAPQNIRNIPRKLRLETLYIIFEDGFTNFDKLNRSASFQRHVAGVFLKLFVCHPTLACVAEHFFSNLYFPLVNLRAKASY